MGTPKLPEDEMSLPTPLMLALSAAVLAIDPSVPLPSGEPQARVEDDAEHWRAVASYAQAFPRALAKRVGSLGLGAEEQFDVALDGMGMVIASAARELSQSLGKGKGSA